MTKKFLCCDVFKEEVLSLTPPPDTELEFISMGLHLHPAKLHQEIQRVLDQTSGYSLVILGFGLCGSSLTGIKAPDCPMVMPRVHDCIPVLLGSKARYNTFQQENNQTFYFSGGWVEGERMMIPEYERSCAEFGPKRALRVFRMMFEHYNRLMYIHTGHPRAATTLQKTKDFGGTLQLPCVEMPGSLEYLKKLLFGPWDKEHFVLIPAHGVINEEEFLTEGEQLHIQGA
ncbi:MAG: DUF1638 domain-containing protein [Eubacteriales bacterium]